MQKEENILIKQLNTLIKLNTLSLKLNALSLVEGKSQTEKIFLLSKVGFAPKEIADLIGTTPNTVRVALVDIKKSIRKRGGQNGKVQKQSTS
jgi:DNA-directed RNA polymerase specialized sigma24 family protein